MAENQDALGTLVRLHYINGGMKITERSSDRSIDVIVRNMNSFHSIVTFEVVDEANSSWFNLKPEEKKEVLPEVTIKISLPVKYPGIGDLSARIVHIAPQKYEFSHVKKYGMPSFPDYLFDSCQNTHNLENRGNMIRNQQLGSGVKISLPDGILELILRNKNPRLGLSTIEAVYKDLHKWFNIYEKKSQTVIECVEVSSMSIGWSSDARLMYKVPRQYAITPFKAKEA